MKELAAAMLEGFTRSTRPHSKLLLGKVTLPFSIRTRIASRQIQLYLKSEKLRALLLPQRAKRILFSEKPDWVAEILSGFRRLPHQVEFGPITEDCFRRYDVVVPLTISALEDACRCSPLQHLALPLPSAESLHLCNEKQELNQALISAGFAGCIPEMASGRPLKPPYILKKSVSVWGKDCYIVRNREDEAPLLNLISNPAYFCQQLIPGFTEFATHILFVRGKIVKALNIKYEFATSTPIKGQDQVLFRSIRRCPYLGLFAQILQTIQFEGLCCVNYKVVEGQPFLLEINPRFGGSLAPFFFSFLRHLG